VLEGEPVKLPWFIKDEDVPYEIIMENSVDVLHADHLHSGMVPIFDRYTGFGPSINMTSIINYFDKDGFSASLYWNDPAKTFDINFIAPYYTIISDIPYTVFTVHIPLNETHTKYIGCAIFNTDINSDIANYFLRLFEPLTKKIGKDIHNQDYNVFKIQEKYINKIGRKYIYGGPGDVGVCLLRKWLKKYNTEGCDEDCEIII
tara:strand:- start:1704 stop:2312 length:609 start_codon:yes stop_codon:yes gene_type:complete